MEKFYSSVIKQFCDPMTINVEQIDVDSKTLFFAPPPSSAFNIKFILGHQSDISFQFLKQDSAADDQQRQAVRRAPLPKREINFTISSSDCELSNARKVIDQELKNLVTTPSVRQRMSETALDTMTGVIKSKPRHHNSIEINLCAHVSIKFCFDETRMPIFDENLCRVFKDYTTPVPDSKTCSICLDDITNNRARYVVLEQCLHKFHMFCIGKWLGKRANINARVCPNCRCSIPRPPRQKLPRLRSATMPVDLQQVP